MAVKNQKAQNPSGCAAPMTVAVGLAGLTELNNATNKTMMMVVMMTMHPTLARTALMKPRSVIPGSYYTRREKQNP
jgi:hypothetical protein